MAKGGKNGEQKKPQRFLKTLAENIRTQFSVSEQQILLSTSSDSLKNLLKSSIDDLPDSSLKLALLNDNSVEDLVDKLRKKLQTSSSEAKDNALESSQDLVDKYLIIQRSPETFRDEGYSAFDDLQEAFRRHLEENTEPTLDLIWSFASVTYLSQKPQNFESSLDVARALFQCTAVCTSGNRCSENFSIAALVPVIALLFKSVRELEEKSSNKAFDKKEMKVFKNLKETVNEVLGFVTVCRKKTYGGSERKGLSLRRCISCCDALVCCKSGERERCLEKLMEELFPLSTSSTLADLLDEDGCDLEQLAGVVNLEAMLLRLLIEIVGCQRANSFGSCLNNQEIQRNLRILAVSCITTSKNLVFYDLLLQLLLGPSLPRSAVMRKEEEILLRGILFEATTLVDYQFLSQRSENQAYDCSFQAKELNKIFLNRLAVAQKAIQFFKSQGERSWALSFLKTFSKIPLPSDLMQWLYSQLNTSTLSRSKLEDVIGMLVNMEDERKLKQILNKHSAFSMDTTGSDTASLDKMISKNQGKHSLLHDATQDDDNLFIVDKSGDRNGFEDAYAVEMSLIGAAHDMVKEGDATENQDIQFEKHAQTQPFKDHSLHSLPASDLHENHDTDSDISERKRRYGILDSDQSDTEDSDSESNDLDRTTKKQRVDSENADI